MQAARRPIAALVLAAALVAPGAGRAQNAVPVIRDAEIEALVADYARPVLAAAGLGKSNVSIILVNDPSFNAFVAGRRLFINTGALVGADTPNEIIGVIAHEAGHIAGGHQDRMREQLARANTLAILSAVIGVGAVAVGGATRNKDVANAGTGIMAGGTELARRGFLSYQRSEESAADRMALTYLEKTGQSARGMIRTFKRFDSALGLSGARIDPYLVSHPMPRDRIAALETLAGKSAHYNKPDSAALQLRHDLMRAKIAVHSDQQGVAARVIGKSSSGQPGAYYKALNEYKRGNPKKALAAADALIKANPGSPWYHELRADILMKANKPDAAADSYRKALKLDPNRSVMLGVGLGQALIATGDEDKVRQAAKTLRDVIARDRENGLAYMMLSQAEGRLGNVAEAELALADGYFYQADYKQARNFAARAQQKLKRGSPGWLRAADILAYKASTKK